MKILWSKTDISHLADLNGDYRKLDKVLSETEKKECSWKKGINKFNFEQTKRILKILFPFLSDEQVITMLYKDKSITQVI